MRRDEQAVHAPHATPGPDAGLLRDDELEFIVGGLERPLERAHALDVVSDHLGSLDLTEGG